LAKLKVEDFQAVGRDRITLEIVFNAVDIFVDNLVTGKPNLINENVQFIICLFNCLLVQTSIQDCMVLKKKSFKIRKYKPFIQNKTTRS